ncbi:hypothetical protein BN1723_015859 [Verticillium longisporum]|uniref:Uncharacterized protein n=1 Tax=Verticillium longisporum TaxID=100787 RepID=A0A0G4N3H3_VERLO|nr:hypothetical protein BN1723_015859 [Verticillium longisporum]
MPLANRLFSLVPPSFAAVAFALTVLLLAAGSSPVTSSTYFWLALNTSRLGENLIEITPADTSQSDNPLSPIVEGLFGDLRDDLINGLGEGVQDLQGALVGNLTSRLGVRDAYGLFVRNICEGTYASESAGSAMEFNDCLPYEDKSAGLRRIAASIPSTFALGPANVSIPLVEALSSTLDSALSLATRGAKALFALLIISALATGTSVVASTLTVILAPRRWLVRTNLLASVLGGLSLPLSATVTTGLILIGSSALKEVGYYH